MIIDCRFDRPDVARFRGGLVSLDPPPFHDVIPRIPRLRHFILGKLDRVQNLTIFRRIKTTGREFRVSALHARSNLCGPSPHGSPFSDRRMAGPLSRMNVIGNIYRRAFGGFEKTGK
jgi:hypothetical protein